MAPRKSPAKADDLFKDKKAADVIDTSTEPGKKAPSPDFKFPDGIRDVSIATFLIVLAAITSRVSQLSLAPVYGSIPSSVNHQAAIAATALIGWTTQWFWRPRDNFLLQAFPLWAVLAPALTCFSFYYSEDLGLVWGPIVGGFLSCHSVVLPMIYAAAASYDGPDVKETSSGPLAHLFSGLPSLSLFMVLDWFLPDTVNKFIATWSFLNPFNAQLIIGLYLIFALTDRRTIIAVTVTTAAIAATFSPYGNGPFSTLALETTLQAQNWTLLSRQWSNTGYISVLQSNEAAYRVMRCDHSLLGGEWQFTDARRAQGWTQPESIYAAFHMLEAVRLMETEPQIEDASAQALIVGLGIGTAPKAFIGHGINTTIIELDPVVHQFATDYFGLPKNHTPVLSDAIAWVRSEAHPKPTNKEELATDPSASPEIPEVKQYDYIVHDVFTGGAEPLALFTNSFLSNLRSLLKPNGVAAINYAGDLSLPLTAKVLNTIDLAFDRNCALYRDSAPPSKEEQEQSDISPSFANYILFCRNTPGPITFRRPTAADSLGSISRKQHLYPRDDFAVEFPLRTSEKKDDFLVDAELSDWKAEQEESAARHWGIMRVVMPARIWNLY